MNIREEIANLHKVLNTIPCGTKEWDRAYNRLIELEAKEQEEYRAENIDKLKAFYDEHIANRKWEEIEQEAWDWYSDYHKDVFGYRPRSLNWEE